jgi:hypothetical protein
VQNSNSRAARQKSHDAYYSIVISNSYMKDYLKINAARDAYH